MWYSSNVCSPGLFGARLRSAIVGGHNAVRGSTPWMVHLNISAGGVEKWRCGGTLLNEQWVLTSAGCLDRWEYYCYFRRASIIKDIRSPQTVFKRANHRPRGVLKKIQLDLYCYSFYRGCWHLFFLGSWFTYIQNICGFCRRNYKWIYTAYKPQQIIKIIINLINEAPLKNKSHKVL